MNSMVFQVIQNQLRKNQVLMAMVSKIFISVYILFMLLFQYVILLSWYILLCDMLIIIEIKKSLKNNNSTTSSIKLSSMCSKYICILYCTYV